MSFPKQSILGVGVTTAPKEKILEEIDKGYISARGSGVNRRKTAPEIIRIVTPNPEQIMASSHDAKLAGILNRADVALPDGSGAVWAAARLPAAGDGSRASVRIPGVDFFTELISLAARRRVRIGLIGGRTGVALKALECLREANPGLSGWAEDGPEMGMEGSSLTIGGSTELFWEYTASLAARITGEHTGMVFLGLGSPKQEYVMDALVRHIHSPALPLIIMSVGGSFDIVSGRIPRAPSSLQSAGLEWAWRLGREPSRIGRQLVLPRFVMRVLIHSRP